MSEPLRRYSWDDYLYPPDKNGRRVLRNKLGLGDLLDWYSAERRLTAMRAAELAARPDLVPRTFDTAHWKAIHYQLFQDIYEWAGEFRTVDIGKEGHDFVPADRLDGCADEILGRVRAANQFAGRDRAGVVDDLMYTMQAVNIIHPFREGNGRTQRLLIEHIAERAGYVMDWERIDLTQQNVMMAAAFDGDLAPLRDGLTRAALPIFRGGAVDESPWLTRPAGAERAQDFWQLSKPGSQVLTESRAAGAAPSDIASSTPAPPMEQQHELGR